ncbi:MAG: ADP-forming succinate--CoA ligase subunit beta [Mariprofundus sp.]|nr:ADP-forming succinate--CoA ligase subunit beta [Mariprofundus sp.]
MNIHEYQAKAVLKKFGVSVPAGVASSTVASAVAAATELGGDVWVVKAQIHAGGRGKAGGVRLCHSLNEVSEAASALLGSTLVTAQTAAAGKQIHKVYVEQGLDIAHEYYLSLLVDRQAESLSFVVSSAGGMDIERVAATTPQQILSCPVDGEIGVSAANCAMMIDKLGLRGRAADAFPRLAEALYRTFVDSDCSLLELNPLVETAAGELVALDAKMAIDDNALYRQADLAAMRDLAEEEARETEAATFGLNYIALDGRIGCMVNGAGLAMGTMDIIQLKGDKPANFLDVGGGVTVDAVCEAFKLLFGDTHVKAILVNIFGGIVRCDLISLGLIEAIKTHPMRVPVVMRLVGTNEKLGKQLIRQAGLDVRWATDLDQAAQLAVAAAGGH